MHCLDLGLLQYVIPSCLVELCEEGVWPGGNRKERFLAAHVEYKVFCNNIGERPAPRFSDTKWCPDGDYPKLTQNLAKAFQTRTMQYWLLEVCLRPGVSGGSHGQMRLALLTSLVKFDEICKDS